ncbi:MAG: ECF transporter S component [Bacilli bacterium]|nr:ECF transporter S component [Bacilli bacterium]
MRLANKRPVFRITFLALNLALYIGLSFISIRLPGQEITFKGLPLVFVSCVSGPLDGVFVAIFGEFIAQLTSAYGLTPTTALWILPHVFRALIVGFMMRKKDVFENKKWWVLTVILSGIAVTVSNSIVIYVDGVIMNYPSVLTAITMLTRAAASIATSIVYIILIPLLIKPIMKAGKLERKSSE